jgi:cytoskeleton protein RodZ
MNFQELGETLQREREAKGLTIKTVMEATKISRVILLALESGDRSSLPHPVYTKGFVKSYARLLGLDPDELSMVVDREFRLTEPESTDITYDVSPNAEKAFQGNEPAVGRKRSVWPSILIVVALCCAVIILVLNLNRAKTPEPVQPAPAVRTEEAPVAPEPPAEVAPEGLEAQPAVEGEQPAEDKAAESLPASEQAAPEVKPEEKSADKLAAKAETKPVPAAPAQPAPAVTEEGADEEAAITQEGVPAEAKYAHVLIIRATTDKGCWIGVWRGEENKLARDFVLRKGEPLRLMFNSPRRIRIGNVAGVTVTYNGQPYPLDSNKSNIQTLTFGM